jgi:hypothetical protein
MAILWREKRGIHVAAAEGKFINEQGTAMKPLILADCNCHTGYVDKGDRLANSYSISHCTCQCTNILFFLLLDLNTLNSQVLLSSCCKKKISLPMCPFWY